MGEVRKGVVMQANLSDTYVRQISDLAKGLPEEKLRKVLAEVVVGQLLQLCQLGVDGGSAGEVGIEGGLLGVHRGLRG